MDEVKRTKDNLNQMEDLKFSEDTPVLYFLSENNLEMFSAWKKIAYLNRRNTGNAQRGR